MTATVSARTGAVMACSYDDFPVPQGAVDLRGDGAPPPAAVTAALAALGPAAWQADGYGDVAGDPGLRALLGDVFGVPAEQVIVTAGGSEALHLALLCTTDRGDTVLLPRPAFPGFDELARLAGLHVRHYPVPGPIPASSPAVTATLVCTPHNPTGVVTGPGDLPHRTGWTIWDACHMPLTGPPLTELRGRLTGTDVVIFSLSKLLRLPGARIGCLIARDRDLITAAVAAKTHLSMSTSRPAQRLAAAVLAAPSIRTEITARHHAVAAAHHRIAVALAGTGAFTVCRADAGTHLFATAIDGIDAWKQLAAAGVVGLPGTVFHAPARTVRLCVSQPGPVLDTAVAALQTW